MADNPLAIRASESVKTLFNELAETGDFENKGEFLARLLAMYQAETMKGEVTAMKPAIEAVETLTGRLLEVLVGAGAAIKTNEEKHWQELCAERDRHSETWALLEQRAKALEDERDESVTRASELEAAKESAEEAAAELSRQNGLLESALLDKSALADEYKEKCGTLAAMAADLASARSQYESLAAEISAHAQESGRQRLRIEELERELKRQAAAHAEDAARMAKEAEQGMINALRAASLDKSEAVLELKKAHQALMEEQQARHVSAISAYEDKVSGLLEMTSGRKASGQSAGKQKAASTT